MRDPVDPAAPQRPGWPDGAATGVGSMPGTDVREATFGVVLGELPDLPLLPELPGRGPGADMIGRTLALLSTCRRSGSRPAGRVSDRAGADARRARSLLDEDLDALEEMPRATTAR